ncbi:hypothetical protein FB451DRAFT_1485038 [Mycena latifolia]|nr:hypothetical protein FB451DRAFT_1485038 [Mycena latifolia]
MATATTTTPSMKTVVVPGLHTAVGLPGVHAAQYVAAGLPDAWPVVLIDGNLGVPLPLPLLLPSRQSECMLTHIRPPAGSRFSSGTPLLSPPAEFATDIGSLHLATSTRVGRVRLILIFALARVYGGGSAAVWRGATESSLLAHTRETADEAPPVDAESARRSWPSSGGRGGI